MKAALRAVCLAGALMTASSAMGETTYEVLEFSDLDGWARDDHAAALSVFLNTCPDMTGEEWLSLCALAQQDGAKSPRAFFELFFRPVLIRDVQQHVTRLTPIHADLIQVDLTQTIRAVVQVVISVMPRLAETGAAIAAMQTTELTVEALPENLPQQIEVDASGLVDFDTSIKAGEIDLGPDVTLIDDPETVLIALSRPRAAVVEDEEAGESEEGAEDAGGETEDEGDSGSDEG